MKLKQFGLLTVASLALVACSNESDPVLGGEDNAPKKVVLKLEGISQGTKSTDANTESSSTTMTVSNIAVILYDANGKIDKCDKINVSDVAESDWEKITGESGKTYEDVDPNVDRVMVIGNTSSIADFDTKFAAGEEISTVNSLVIDLKSQNQAGTGTDKTTKGNLTLFDDQLLKNTGNNDDGVQIYSAELAIKPLISRLEVKNIKCTFRPDGKPVAGTGVSSFTVLGIGLVDYYNQLTLGTQAVVDESIMEAKTTKNADGKILPPSFSEVVPEGSYIFCKQSDPDTNWTWAFDNISSDNTLSYTAGSGEQTATMNKTFAYNFFPSTSMANVRLYLQSNNQDKFVVTANFGQTPERGNIYQFEYAFDETVPGSWDKDQKVVLVKVTVTPWTITPVTPDFQ